MTIIMTMEPRERLPFHRSIRPRVAVGLAFVLVKTLRPNKLEHALRLFSRGAEPASADQAAMARRKVSAVSAKCAGQYCLERSVATAILLRLTGVWATWVSGVCLLPFAAHAWIEVDGIPISEPLDLGDFHKNIIVDTNN